jgi:hypothetical protein
MRTVTVIVGLVNSTNPRAFAVLLFSNNHGRLGASSWVFLRVMHHYGASRIMYAISVHGMATTTVTP